MTDEERKYRFLALNARYFGGDAMPTLDGLQQQINDLNSCCVHVNEDITELKDELKDIVNGEIVLTTGQLVTGYYPTASGIAASASAKMAVFPVEDEALYYVSWMTGSNKYRTAFGNTPPDEIVVGTSVYEYIDNNTTTHDRYPRKNSNYDYLYVYIGNTAAATIDSVEVAAKIKSSIDDCTANDGDQW